MERRDMKFFGENEPAIKVVTQRLLGIINFLLEVIKNKEQESQPRYRLEDIIEIRGIWYCKVHVVMTNIVNDYLPKDIVNDDVFLSGFCALDVRSITYLANYDLHKPSKRITSINYEENTIDIIENGNRSSIFIDEKVQSTIDFYSQKDAFNLGIMIGENSSKK